MNRLHTYFQLGLADFRERTRRSAFIVTLLGILFFGYLVITGKYTINFGEYRTVYDSAWAGHIMAVCSSIILGIVGFYIVRGTVKRDRRTEVGQIIAAAPMSKWAYVASKFLSNIMVLGFMVAVLALAAFLTLLIRNEADGIDLAAFITPFLAICIPAIAFVASMAVLFDCVRWLSGSIGNIVYLFAAEACLVMGMLTVPYLDLGGISVFTESIHAAARTAFPGEKIPLIAGFVILDPLMQIGAFKTFSWNGIEWTGELIRMRLFWVAAAILVTGAAVPFFDRFDPALSRRLPGRKKKKVATEAAIAELSHARPNIAYSELSPPVVNFSLIRMTLAELRLSLKGYHWFWYLVAIGLCVSQLTAPFDVARQYIIPVAMVWPVVVWSSMATRESQHATSTLLFSSPSPLSRQFPAVFLSGLVVAIMAIGCMLVRSVMAGLLLYPIALTVAALLVPTAALAMGTLSKSRRLFEVLYLVFWYVGSIEHLAAVDLLGTTDEAITAGKLIALGLLSALFLIGAFAARHMQIRRSR